MKIIKVGFLMSYDYNYLKMALPRVYPFVDEIFLCIDIDRKTWAGDSFEVNDEFWNWLKVYDTDNKIEVYEDSFFIPELTPIECDTRERKMLAERMGKSDWYIQIDSDEYFLDFDRFVKRLKHFKISGPTTVHCRVIPLFKKTDNGFLVIKTAAEALPFATNRPDYTSARACLKNNFVNVFWEDLVIHQSWARSEDEIKTKLHNWGHKNDFNTNSYYNLWKAMDENNYIYLIDFHPLDRTTWSKLELIRAKNMTELIEKNDWENLVKSKKNFPFFASFLRKGKEALSLS